MAKNQILTGLYNRLTETPRHSDGDVLPDPCPLCRRPNDRPSDHHLIPKSKGGRVTKTICVDCHRTVHAFFTNQELKKTYNTIEALLTHINFAKAVAWIGKQSGAVRIRTHKRRR